MELQNGYKIIYEAKDRETPGYIFAGKGLPSKEDAMLVSYNNGESYIDLKSFKLIYSDGTHLFGSVSGIPSEEDINIVLKGGEEIVFGEVIGDTVEEEPVVEEPKEETPVEEPVVEEEKEPEITE